MPECLKIEEWRAATQNEVAEFLDVDEKRPKEKRQSLVVRTYLRPVDVYTYLKARFGEPNGFQNFLRKDDSDNWIHWDFNLKSGDVDVYFAGTSRETHIMVDEPMTDLEWHAFIGAVRSDFARVAKEKSEVLRTLEKYVLFQNKYVTLANLCAELHEQIVDAPSYEALPKDSAAYESDKDGFKEAMKRVSDRGKVLYGNCLKLRLLTPIMAEAFINMIILMFCKNAIRDDDEQYQAFIRAKVPERLELLSKNCDGFARSIDKKTDAYENFMRVIDKRNFALHGNVNPLNEPMEVVYFDGRRPLFVNPGHNVDKLFQHLEEINKPQEAIKEYEGVHAFLYEIVECLTPQHQTFCEQVIDDAYPGYEVKKRRPTRILPDQIVMGVMQGMRYDDELAFE